MIRALQLGLKYAVDAIGTQRYWSFSGLTGAELRYDISERFDLGLRANALVVLPSNTVKYSAGPSLGYSLTETIWASAGFNLIGFEDEDFQTASHNTAGPFVQFRMRFEPSNAQQLQQLLDQL